MKINNRVEVENIIKKIVENNFLVQNDSSKCYFKEIQIQLKLAFELYKELGCEPVLEHDIESDNCDIYFEIGGKRYGVELKYKTKENNKTKHITHGAQLNGSYFYLNDIKRLEEWKYTNEIDFGMAILITNDPAYYTEPNKEKTQRFNLVGSVGTSYHAEWKSLPDKYKEKQKIVLKENTYKFEWSESTDSEFRYCCVSI